MLIMKVNDKINVIIVDDIQLIIVQQVDYIIKTMYLHILLNCVVYKLMFILKQNVRLTVILISYTINCGIICL